MAPTIPGPAKAQELPEQSCLCGAHSLLRGPDLWRTVTLGQTCSPVLHVGFVLPELGTEELP